MGLDTFTDNYSTVTTRSLLMVPFLPSLLNLKLPTDPNHQASCALYDGGKPPTAPRIIYPWLENSAAFLVSIRLKIVGRFLS